MRRRALPSVAAVAVLLALSACGSAEGKAHADSTLRTKARPTARVATAPVVMFLGDSYTTGKLGQLPEQTYAAQTARDLGWQVILGGFRGTGFVARGHVGKDFAALFQEQLAWRPAPDLVIISGGHNDVRHPPRVVGAAALRLLTTIRQRWPKTKLLMIGPMWGGDPTREASAIRTALAAVAARAHVPFVDPLAERWITGRRSEGTGNAPRYILSDGTHPTPAGARYLADRLVTDLRKLHLATP